MRVRNVTMEMSQPTARRMGLRMHHVRRARVVQMMIAMTLMTLRNMLLTVFIIEGF